MAINVGTAIAYLDLDVGGFTSKLNSAKSALQEFVTSSDSMSTKFQNFGSAVSSFGSSMTKTVTVPIVGVGTAVTKVASDFESAMSKVQAISGATADEMVQLKDKAIEMGAKTKFSAKESADAFTYMAMAGWKAEDMINGIAGIMSLAAADGLDLATTSDIVTDALTAFGLQAKDSAHFADVLAQASSSSNTNVSMLGESFKYVAPVAGALGMSVEDVAIALGLMANSGIKSSQAGTALRASLTNLVKPTDAMSNAMEDLSIEVTNSDGSMKSLREIMDILREKFSTLSEAEQANTAATLFGKEAMSGMLAIINASATDYDTLSEAIDSCNGRADSMAETMMGNLSGSIEELMGAIETLAIKLGDILIPVIQDITKLITSWVEKLDNLSTEQLEQIVRIAAVIAAVGPLLLIIGKVISIIGTVIQIGTKLFAGIKILVGFIGGTLIPAISAIGAPVLIVIGIIAALIAIGVALYKNWDTVSAWAKKAWSAITETVKNAVEAIGDFFSDLGEGVADVISSIGDWLSNLWDSISGFFENLFSNIGNWFQEVTSSIASFFSNLAGTVASAIGEIWNTIVSWGKNMIDKAKEIGSGFVDTFVNFFKNLVQNVKDAISGMIEMITSWGSNLLNKAKEIGSGFTSAITSGLQKVGSFFSDIFTDIINAITTFGPKLFEIGKSIITSLWQGMKAVFSSVVKWITDSLSTLFKPITDMFNKVLSPIKNFFGGIGSTIGGWFSGSHANGLDYVPYNGYVAQLHQGERVLTKEENREYSGGSRSRSGGGDTYIFNSPEPIDEYQAARLIKQTKQELDMDM